MADEQNHAPNPRQKPRRKKSVRNQNTMNLIDDRKAVALRFRNTRNADEAIARILKHAPDHPFLFPDSLTIIMNKDDQHLFDGLQYDPQEVATPEEVSNEEMAELRDEHLFRKA